MCVVLIYHDRDDAFPLRVLETRDENVYRPQGSNAVRLVRGVESASYAEHWSGEAGLEGVFLLHEDRGEVVRARPLGSFDRHRGTWLAVGQETGVYARLLIAIFADGTFAENSTPELMKLRAGLGYAKRGGLCLDAVAFPSARAAAEGMRELARRAFARAGKKLLPNYLVVADARDAFVLHLDETSRMHAIELPQRELTMISIRGINAPDSVMTRNLIGPLRAAERPRPDAPDGWDAWLRICSIQGNFGDTTARPGAVPYLDPAWRSHQHSIIQPPYLNVEGPRSHIRPAAGTLRREDVVEWTASSTCVAADRSGRLSLLVNERQLAPGEAVPDTLAACDFPCTTADYTPVALRNGFGPSRPAIPA